MRIVRIIIQNFRCIREAEIFPLEHNVLLGPTNVGKTAVIEAINLVLSPEVFPRPGVINENDFYNRIYGQDTSEEPEYSDVDNASNTVPGPTRLFEEVVDDQTSNKDIRPHEFPIIRIELVLAELNTEDEDIFRENLVPWKEVERTVLEYADEGTDPFECAKTAIRVVFEGWYDLEEDTFDCKTFFLRAEGIERDECPTLTKTHKRHIGFLIYRDFRALTRPITLHPSQLFSRLMFSQKVTPMHFENAISDLKTALHPMTHDDSFLSLLNSYKAELERFLVLSEFEPSALSF